MTVSVLWLLLTVALLAVTVAFVSLKSAIVVPTIDLTSQLYGDASRGWVISLQDFFPSTFYKINF